MDECPKCGRFTLVYYPQREENVCGTCGYHEKLPYETYIKQKNVADSLRYPHPGETANIFHSASSASNNGNAVKPKEKPHKSLLLTTID